MEERYAAQLEATVEAAREEFNQQLEVRIEATRHEFNRQLEDIRHLIGFMSTSPPAYAFALALTNCRH